MDLPTLPSRHHIPKLLVQLGLDGIGLEVGVDQGKFSKVILENSRLSLLVSLDFGNRKRLMTKRTNDCRFTIREAAL